MNVTLTQARLKLTRWFDKVAASVKNLRNVWWFGVFFVILHPTP